MNKNVYVSWEGDKPEYVLDLLSEENQNHLEQGGSSQFLELPAQEEWIT